VNDLAGRTQRAAEVLQPAKRRRCRYDFLACEHAPSSCGCDVKRGALVWVKRAEEYHKPTPRLRTHRLRVACHARARGYRFPGTGTRKPLFACACVLRLPDAACMILSSAECGGPGPLQRRSWMAGRQPLCGMTKRYGH